MHTSSEIRDLIEKLGGYEVVSALTGTKTESTRAWPRCKKFPAKTYRVLREALQQRGIYAPDSLWGQK
jgi:hypothetical protein